MKPPTSHTCDEDRYVQGVGNRCDGCIDQSRYEECPSCNELFDVYDGCQNCITCDECGDLTGTVHAVLNETYVCSDCRTRYFRECHECGTFYRRTEGCEPCAESESDYYDDGDGVIHGYEYRPNPVFHGNGPLYFGLEAEVSTYRADNSRWSLASLAQTGFGNVAYLKSDCSIDDGFEIVTHPMSWEYARTEFPWRVFEALNARGCSGDDTGIHVHVSRVGFSGSCHTFRWMKFIYRNQANVQRYARRQSGQWAPFRRSDRAEQKEYCKGAKSYDRYAAINTTNEHTFELRIFRGSVSVPEILGAIGFAAATVEYTRTLTTHDITKANGWSWRAFVAWLVDKPEYAPVLAQVEATGCDPDAPSAPVIPAKRPQRRQSRPAASTAGRIVEYPDGRRIAYQVTVNDLLNELNASIFISESW